MIKRTLGLRNKYKTKLFLITIFLIFGCRQINPDRKDISCNAYVTYDIQIDYNSILLDNEKKLAGGDSLAIGFYGMFANDTVSIYKNKEFFKTTILTSDSQTEDAGYIMLDKYQFIENVWIKINGGPLIYIEICKRDYHICLNFQCRLPQK